MTASLLVLYPFKSDNATFPDPYDRAEISVQRASLVGGPVAHTGVPTLNGVMEVGPGVRPRVGETQGCGKTEETRVHENKA